MKLPLIMSFFVLFFMVGSARKPVVITVYYESYCKASRKFLAEQLGPTYQLISEIMIVNLVAYGNSWCDYDGDGSCIPRCHHGPKECRGNLIQGCANEYYPSSQTVPFVACCSDLNGCPNKAAQMCAFMNEMDWYKIYSCVTTCKSKEIRHKMKLTTYSAIPAIDAIPWITINHKYSEENQARAETNLLSLICDMFEREERPDNCRQS